MASVVDAGPAEVPKAAAPAKREFDEAELAISTLLGGFFTALSIADLSMDMYVDGGYVASNAARAHYLGWKGNAPIISHAMLLLIVPLPFVIFGIVHKEVLPLFGFGGDGRALVGAARTLRLLGSGTLALILGVVTTVVVAVQPTEKACIESVDSCVDMWFWHLVVVCVNIVLLIVPFMRFQAARAMEQEGKQR